MAAKKNAKIPERVSVMMPTLGDWYPSFKINNHPSGLSEGVKVSFLELLPFRKYPQMWRVCVWGNDDFGMERDFESRADAHQMFTLITSWETVEVYELLQHEFVYCQRKNRLTLAFSQCKLC